MTRRITMLLILSAWGCQTAEPNELVDTNKEALSASQAALSAPQATLPLLLQSTSGPIPPNAVREHDALKRSQTTSRGAAAAASQNVISGVPAYLWHHGCGPTAAGMLVGYYDANGYSLISGDAVTQTGPVNQAIASGGDDEAHPFATAQHFEDYALPIDSGTPSGTDPLPDAYLAANRTPHANNSLADYMNTSRSDHWNKYGWSWDNDVEPAVISYVHQVAPTVTVTSQTYNGTDMTWQVLTQEIDAHRPMIFLVDSDGDGGTDHFVPVIGYREGTPRQYASLDTWSTEVRWETFAPINAGVYWGIAVGHAFSFSGGQPACTADSQCSDGIACTVDRCTSGACTHDATSCGCTSNAQCDDGNFCNGIETCVANSCVAGTSWGTACTQATLLSRYQSSGNFNTLGEKWFYMTDELNGWWTANMQGRTVRVNGQTVTPGQTPLPAAINGKRYFQFTSGSSLYTSWGSW